MRKVLTFTLALWAAGLAGQQPTAEIPDTPIRVSTRMVQIDVIATGKDGEFVGNLQANDFTVLEDGKPQPVAGFQVEPGTHESAQTMPPLPQHVYTNRIEYRDKLRSRTVILLDALNTPTSDQMYARWQLFKYLKTQLQPDQRVAVYGLANHLHLLQDFTSDPELIRHAIDSFTVQDSRLLRIEKDVDSGPASADEKLAAARAGAQSALRNMLEERAAVAYSERVAETIWAFRGLANSLGGFPGRKNLVWISGSFPIVFSGQNSVTGSTATRIFSERTVEQAVREAAERLAQAQVAVYPVDARGLMGASVFDASQPMLNEMGRLSYGSDFGSAVSQNDSALLPSQATMEEIASFTGGKAYVNQNEISHAVASSVADGASYYSLAYYPTNKNWDGKLRYLKIVVDQPGIHLRYRRGYYAFDLNRNQKPQQKTDYDVESAISGYFFPATMIRFDARVVPPTDAGQTTIPVELLVDVRTLSSEPLAGGKQSYGLDFHIAAVEQDGTLVTRNDQHVEAVASPNDLGMLHKQGLPLRGSVVLSPGNYRLRVVVQDTRTRYWGSVEVPLSLVTRDPKKH